jgi:hypothetical protein
VEKRDGSVTEISSGQVFFEAGGNISFAIDENRDEILVNVLTAGGNEDPYYSQKLDALSNLPSDSSISGPFPDPDSGLTPEGDPWVFTSDSLWIGSMNNVPADPVSGDFFLGGDVCNTFGAFEDSNRGYPQTPRECDTSSSSGLCGAELEIINICTPCLDCLEYQRIEDYLQRIEVFYDYLLELSTDRTTDPSEIPEHPDGGIREDLTGVFEQITAAREYWDHLLHNSTVKLAVQGQGQSIVAAVFYRNISDFTVGAGTGVSVDVAFQFTKNGSPWAGINTDVVEIRELNRNGKPSAGVISSTITGGHTITASMEFASPAGLASGEEFYADVALLILNTTLFEEIGEEFTVDVTMTITPTHIIPPTTIVRTDQAHFRPADSQGGASSSG